MRTWQFQEAKRRLGDVLNSAVSEGPQVVTRDGSDVVVIISVEDYQRLLQKEGALIPGMTAMQWLISHPSSGQRSKAAIDADLDSERDW